MQQNRIFSSLCKIVQEKKTFLFHIQLSEHFITYLDMLHSSIHSHLKSFSIHEPNVHNLNRDFQNIEDIYSYLSYINFILIHARLNSTTITITTYTGLFCYTYFFDVKLMFITFVFEILTQNLICKITVYIQDIFAIVTLIWEGPTNLPVAANHKSKSLVTKGLMCSDCIHFNKYSCNAYEILYYNFGLVRLSIYDHLKNKIKK